MNKTLTAAALILCGTTLMSADAAVTMRQAVHKAVTTNPTVSAEEAAERAAERDIRDAKADLYPSLDLTGRTGYAYTRKKYYRDTPMSAPRNGEANRFTGQESARLSQIIFDGFRTGNSIERAEHAHGAADATLLQTQEGVGLDAVAAFIDVRARQRLLSLAVENIETHENILSKVRQRVSGGLGTVADTRQVEARLQDAKVAREQIEGDLQVAVARYIDVVGEEPHDLTNPYMPIDALPGHIDEIVALALMENPQVKIAENQLRVAESDYEITGAPFWPTIRAESEVSGEHNIDGIKGDEASVTVQLVGEYNIYSGGRDTARRGAQRNRMAEAKYRLGIARRAAEREVRSGWAELHSARDQAVELVESVRINDKLRNDYFIQFDLGDRSLLDVLDAEVAYFRARSNRILAEANEDINLARVLSATARLLPALDVGHPPAHEDSHLSDPVSVTNEAGPGNFPFPAHGMSRDDAVEGSLLVDPVGPTSAVHDPISELTGSEPHFRGDHADASDSDAYRDPEAEWILAESIAFDATPDLEVAEIEEITTVRRTMSEDVVASDPSSVELAPSEILIEEALLNETDTFEAP